MGTVTRDHLGVDSLCVASLVRHHLLTKVEELLGEDVDIEVTTISDAGYKISAKNIFSFTIEQLPNNHQALIFGRMLVFIIYQGKGLAQVIMQFKLDLCEKMGYKLALCTVRKDNTIEQHILKKFGWQETCVPNSSFSLWTHFF